MLFSSTFFLFFFLPLLILLYYRFTKEHSKRNRLLLVFSLIFYAWGEPLFVFVMAGCILANYWFAREIELDYSHDKKKYILILMLSFNLGLLAVFKYAGFIVGNLNSLFSLELGVPHIALPIGISFFTFQGISYVIDVHRKKAEAFKNPFDVGLYISFFPQLIAGPIVRYETIAKELRQRNATEDDFVQGTSRFILGIAKKVILANQFALIADKAYSFPADSVSLTLAWMGAIAYTLQIYFDFSGYSDMAIGLGKLFGFHFPENFNHPYMAKSISDFWRRWHISLGSWFRDYVYIPLGGSRGGKLIQLRNIAVVWLCTGIWHGANWTFIVWGIYFGTFIIIEKFTGLEKILQKSKVLGHIYTMTIVIFGWVLFRAESITYAVDFIKSMFAMNGQFAAEPIAMLYLHDYRFVYVAGIIACFPLISMAMSRYHKRQNAGENVIAMEISFISVLTLLFMVSAAYLIKGTYNPFIYFNF